MGPVAFIRLWTTEKWNSSLIFTLCFYIVKAVLLLWFLTVTCSCCLYLYFASPIMWVTYLGSWMTTCLGKSCSFGLPLLSVHVFSYFPFVFDSRIWDLIVSFPGLCLSFYFCSIFAKFWYKSSCKQAAKKSYNPTCLVRSTAITMTWRQSNVTSANQLLHLSMTPLRRNVACRSWVYEPRWSKIGSSKEIVGECKSLIVFGVRYVQV